MIPRRTYLRRAVGLAGAGAIATTTASADDSDHDTSHIHSITGDTDVIEDYLPSLVMSHEARQKFVGTYGWKAESTKYDTDAYYYWFKYPTQRGFFEQILGNSPDSHFTDHEPFICFVNPDGTVERAIFSGYHHFVAEVNGSDAVLVEDRVAGQPTHLKLRVVDPWHHFQHYESNDRDGVLPDTIGGSEFRSWLDIREAWYDNGVYSKSHHPAVEDPWVLLDRDTWWEDGSRDAWFARNVWIPLGLRGADETDSLRVE